MKLESLKSEKFVALTKSQMSGVNGGYYAKTSDRFYTVDMTSIADRAEYFLDANGKAKYTGCIELKRADGSWAQEANYWS